MRNFSFRNGFSLTELLAAVACIAFLAALLFPAGQHALKKIRSMKCLSNLRQLQQAAQLYAGDNDGFLPPGWNSTTGQTWITPLKSYLQLSPPLTSRSVIVCPVIPIPISPSKTTIQFSTYSGHGLLFADTSAVGSPAYRIARIPRPSEAILFADASQQPSLGGGAKSTFFWPVEFQSAGSSSPLNQPIPSSIDEDSANGGGWLRYRHDGHCNAVMVDGHAESFQKGTALYRNIIADH